MLPSSNRFEIKYRCVCVCVCLLQNKRIGYINSLAVHDNCIVLSVRCNITRHWGYSEIQFRFFCLNLKMIIWHQSLLVLKLPFSLMKSEPFSFRWCCPNCWWSGWREGVISMLLWQKQASQIFFLSKRP